jgi:hypothetical protein
MTFGPGYENIPVHWFFVPQGTPFLPYATVFNSLNWDDQDTQPDSHLGEDWDAARPWRDGSMPPLACNDLHPFGAPEQWAYGVNTERGGPALADSPHITRAFDCGFDNGFA